MPTFEKHFTLEEANALLPEIRETFAEIQIIQRSLEEKHEDIEALVKASRTNGGNPAGTEWIERVQEIHRLLEQIVSQGIQIKDLQRGLIDFPHWHEGREVFLCWEMGEDRIHYWHDLETGYTGRTPIEEV